MVRLVLFNKGVPATNLSDDNQAVIDTQSLSPIHMCVYPSNDKSQGDGAEDAYGDDILVGDIRV